MRQDWKWLENYAKRMNTKKEPHFGLQAMNSLFNVTAKRVSVMDSNNMTVTEPGILRGWSTNS